jgi:ankyrin repeat protein
MDYLDDSELQLELVKLLLSNRYINVNVKNGIGTTPLMEARYNLKVAVELLKHPNIDVNAKNRDGEPLISYFAGLLAIPEYPVFIAVLRHPKIDVNARKDSNGATLLHILSKIETDDQELSYTAVVDLLTIHPNINPNVSLTIPPGGTPFCYAIFKNNLRIAERITLLKNINYNTIEDDGGFTTFISILYQKNDYFFQKALRHPSTNVNAQIIDGKTALMIAININYRRAVIEILKHPDTDVFVVSNDGRTALDYCRDDLMCKAIIFRRMIWNRKYSQLGKYASPHARPFMSRTFHRGESGRPTGPG